MKLYNLFEQVILEETQKALGLLVEGVDTDSVGAAIDGLYNVNITYRDEGQSVPSKRYIQVYVYGKTHGGNDAIRAYQIDGGTKTVSNGWKIFRLDRIESWLPTNMKWYNPVSDYDASIPPFNQMGDDSFSVVYKIVDPNKFNRKRSDINQKPTEPAPQPPAPTQQQQAPQQPQATNNELNT